MFNYIDLILLLFLIYKAWQGYGKGFLGRMASWAGYGVAFLAAWASAPSLAGFMASLFNLKVWAERLVGFLPFPPVVINQPAGPSAADQLSRLLEGSPLPGFIKREILLSVEKGAGLTLGQVLAGQMAFWLLELLVFCGLFLILAFFLRRLAPRSRIRWRPAMAVDRLLGLIFSLAIYGLLASFVLDLICGCVALPFWTSFPAGTWLREQLAASQLAGLLRDYKLWCTALCQKCFKGV